MLVITPCRKMLRWTVFLRASLPAPPLGNNRVKSKYSKQQLPKICTKAKASGFLYNCVMDAEFFLLWFAVIFPLVYSPGPGNILCAVSGAVNTFRGSAPFIFGLDVVYTFYSVVMGLGMGAVLQQFPRLMTAVQFLGVLYLAYLAFSFFTRAAATGQNTVKRLTFKDGAISQALNIKGISIVTLMYSQFLRPGENLYVQVAVLSAMLLALNLFTHFTWSLGGHWMVSRFASEKAAKIQNRIYGALLLGVAVWLLPLW